MDTPSLIRRITSAVRAVEDLRLIPLAITTLHKRIGVGAASARSQLHLPPAGLVILVENATKFRYGPLLGALATLAWVTFRRVGEVATIYVANIALPGSSQFWYSKNGDEGYTTRTL